MKFSDLVAISELQALCESVTVLTGAATAILDLQGDILVASGWQDICTEFHRVHALTAQRCRESDTVLAGRLSQGESYNVYRCKNGLVDAAVPIVVGGTHIANFFTGQFFFEPPDKAYFLRQAEEFGFDSDTYLDALGRVPVFSEDKVLAMMAFFTRLAQLIGEMGHDRASQGRANLELRESKHLLQTIIDTAPIRVFWKDRDLRYLGCNPAFASDAGKSRPDEVVGKDDYQLAWADQADLYRDDDRRVIESGVAKLFYEEPMTTPDGCMTWIRTAKVPLKNRDDEVIGLLGIYEDVTERKLTEAALRESEERFRSLFNNAEIAMFRSRLDGSEILDCNNKFLELVGRSRQEVIGSPSVILWQDSRQREEMVAQVNPEGRVVDFESRILTKQGEVRHCLTSLRLFKEQGLLEGSIQDITERKRVENQLIEQQAQLEDLVSQRTAELTAALQAAKLAEQAKDEFLANITHELRTPLSAVIGFSNLARPLSTDSRQREYLDKLDSAGKTLSKIIDDLLDLSKIVAGRMEFETSLFSLRQLVARTNSLVSFKAVEKGLVLLERIDDEVPDVLLGDALRLEQILLNLLSNGVKFTAAGRIELRIGVHARTAQRLCLNIEVEDTGIGLRQAELALLFKPFSQADASVTRKFGGTGLGLAICKRLAELMDGDIAVTSREGIGSTFRVRLWIGLGEAGALPLAENESRKPLRVRYQDVHVLVVDDQPFNREIVEGLLAAVGISAYLAGDGQEALDVLSVGGQAFDLVLMDIQMPIMDGLTATRVIRSLDGLTQLPIIAMTAHAMAHEREQYVAAGMNDHIGKPFDEASFYKVLAKWIARSKQSLQGAEVSQPAPASDLPRLRGIDTRAGIALLLGDETRYRHWLGNFALEAPATLQKIRQALATSDADSASMAAHALKGKMGLLGMKELHAIAATLEASIDNAQPTQALFAELERGVAAVCAEIGKGLGRLPDASPVARPSSLENLSNEGSRHG